MSFHFSLMNCFLALVMMIYNWRVNRNAIFLSLLIIILSFYAITAYFLVEDQSRFWIAIFYGHFAPLWFLPGPLLYFYTRGTLDDNVGLKKSDLFHFVPSLLSLVGIFPYIISSFVKKLEFADAIIQDLQAPKHFQADWLIPYEINLLLRPLVLMIYTVICIGMVLRAQKRLSHSSSIPYNQWEFSKKWLLLLSATLFIASIPSLSVAIFYYSNISISRDQVSGNIFMQLTSYALTLIYIILIVFPQVLYGIPRLRDQMAPVSVISQPDLSTNEQTETPERELSLNYAKDDKIDIDPFYKLGERVLMVMKEKRPYLDYDFSLEDLADLLNVPKHHLYYCFQNVLHTKFTRLRTEYRIEHAKKLITEADLRRVTLDSVGRDSGFASTSAFFHTFKAEVGCSPGEYAQANNHFAASDNA